MEDSYRASGSGARGSTLPCVEPIGQRMRAFQSNHARAALVCLVVALAGAVPVQASWTDHPPGKNCVFGAKDARARSAGDNLRPALYKRAVTLVV
jgi:hypothetical protein